MRVILAILAVCTFTAISQSAMNEKASASDEESIGDRLLDDLSSVPARTPGPPTAPEIQQGPKQIEESLKASTPLRGFAASAKPAAQSLARVHLSMQRAQTLLAQRNAELKTGASNAVSPVQQSVLSDLDQLIAELSKKCQCCNGQELNGNQTKESKNSKSGNISVAAGSGRSAARASTERLDRSAAKLVDKAQINEVVQGLWGSLPDRSREQLLQSFSDEFLPKYELEIEQYYRRLSEEKNATESK